MFADCEPEIFSIIKKANLDEMKRNIWTEKTQITPFWKTNWAAEKFTLFQMKFMLVLQNISGRYQ